MTNRLDLPGRLWYRVAICYEYLGNGNWSKHHQWRDPIGLARSGETPPSSDALAAMFARQRAGEESIVVVFELQPCGNWLRVSATEVLPLDGSLPPCVDWISIQQDDIVGYNR